MIHHSPSSNIAYSIHPQYQDEDADLVLLSSDNTGFRVHSFILKRASPIFHDMLELPRVQSGHNDEVQMTETSHLLQDLLQFIYPDSKTIPSVPITFEHAMNLLTAMDKFQMWKAMAILRTMIMAVPYATKPHMALKIYVLACKFSWKEATHSVLLSTLEAALDTSDSLKLMKHLNEDQIAALTDIRQKEEERMRVLDGLLNTKAEREAVVIDGKRGCGRPSHARQLGARREYFIDQLTSMVATEFQKSPNGRTLAGIDFWKEVDQRIFQGQNFDCANCGRWLVDPHRLRKSMGTYLHQHSLLTDVGDEYVAVLL